ncbi:MAG: hypothetical protein RML46_12605 [Anaerolineae bacterium]|nr:hypothetical protein [Anaerolineae bacterium]
MAQLTCILCDCPAGGMVDWRKCQHCAYYGGDAAAGVMDCLHPQAALTTSQPERWTGLREAWGTLHVTLCAWTPETEGSG